MDKFSKKTLLSMIGGAGVYGTSAGQQVSFKYASSISAAIAAVADNGALVFAVDSTSHAGAIWAGTELVSSRVLDYSIADSASKDHGQKTVTLTYIDATTGLTTKTFDLIDEAGLKAYFTGSKTIALNDSNIYEVKVKAEGGVKIDENGAGLFVDIADLFGVDSSTIGFNAQNKLKTLLQLQYHAAVTEVGEEKAAYIALEDVNGNSISEIPVESIIGNGILKSVTYNKDNNTLILVFQQADGTEKTVTVDMKDLIDINDIFLDTAHDADDYLTLTNDTSIATFGVTDKTKTGIALAESALQGISEGSSTENYVTLTVADGTDPSTKTVAINDAALKTKIDEIDGSIGDISTRLDDYKTATNASIARLDSSVSGIETAIAAMDADLSANALDGSIGITLVEGDGKVTSIGITATKAQTTFTEAHDETPASLTSTNGILTGAAIADIVSYVDAKSGALDSTVTDTDDGGFVTVEVVQDNGALTSDTVTVVYGDYDKTSQVNGIATTTATKSYIDTEIQALDSTVTKADSESLVTVTTGIVDGKLLDASCSVALDRGAFVAAPASITVTNDGLVKASEIATAFMTAMQWQVI